MIPHAVICQVAERISGGATQRSTARSLGLSVRSVESIVRTHLPHLKRPAPERGPKPPKEPDPTERAFELLFAQIGQLKQQIEHQSDLLRHLTDEVARLSGNIDA